MIESAQRIPAIDKSNAILSRLRSLDVASERALVIDSLKELANVFSHSARGTLKLSAVPKASDADLELIEGFLKASQPSKDPLDEADAELASAAMYALGAVGGKKELRCLTEAAVNNPYGTQVVEAAEAICRIGGPVAFRLLDVLSSNIATDEGRFAALVAKEELLTGQSSDASLAIDNDLVGIRVHDLVSEFGGTKSKDIALRIRNYDQVLAAQVEDVFTRRFQ